MAAQLDYEVCPECGEIRNASGMTTHRKKQHGVVLEKQA